MNPSTGMVFRGEEAQRMVNAGQAVYISDHVANLLDAGRSALNRKERRATKRKKRPKSKAHYGTW